MADRLSTQDASFLYVERSAAPMHVGTVAIFDLPEGGLDWDRLTALVAARLALVPRFRQRVRQVPGNIANPVWVDDARFDLSYHLRRAALPRPGRREQLLELVARVQSRPLDRNRPLWETYVVEGLRRPSGSVQEPPPPTPASAGGQFALVTKTHQAMVDGVTAVDLLQVMLDRQPEPGSPAIVDEGSAGSPARPVPGGGESGEASTWGANGAPAWRPAPEPTWAELVAGAVSDLVRSPRDVVRTGLSDLASTAGRLSRVASGAGALARTATWLAAQPAPASPLNTATGPHRRFATILTSLDDYRRVRNRRDRRPSTINDVVLTVVTGALRAWLLSRGETVDRGRFLRALVPVSVQGGGVSSYFLDLPVGEPDPLVRLHQVGFRMHAHNVSGQRIGADAIAGLSGFAPPTLHTLGIRVVGGLSRRAYNLVVTNVPGPQEPRYVAGAQLRESSPVVPLPPGQALSVGVTSYLGNLCIGLNGDRDALPDLDVVAQCMTDALDELVLAAAR